MILKSIFPVSRCTGIIEIDMEGCGILCKGNYLAHVKGWSKLIHQMEPHTYYVVCIDRHQLPMTTMIRWLNIELVSMLNKEIVIFGDLNFNYKLDESLSSNPVHLIENLFQLSQIVTEPTRKTLTSSTVIDVILTSVPEKHLESRVLTAAFSDHYSVFTVIDTIKQHGKNGDHKCIRFRDFEHCDEQAFVNDILHSETLENVMSQTDVLKGWYMWKNEFLKVSNKHAPIVERRLKSRNNPWITPNIIKLMYRRDFLHKRAVTLKDESAWEEYKNMRNTVNREVNITKRNYYDNLVTLSRNEPTILLRKINDLVREKKSSHRNVHGISASEFNKSFSPIGKKVSSRLPKQGMPKWKNPPPIHSFIFKEIDVACVHGDLHSLDGDSSNDVL